MLLVVWLLTCVHIYIGTIKYFSGEEYTGFFRDNKRHGRGNLKFNNADVYEGNFSNDRISGKLVKYISFCVQYMK